jgi:hypothetical protein
MEPLEEGLEQCEQSDRSEQLEVDSLIWQHLPDQLLVSILTRLPLPANFQMRRVCKLWNSTLQDHNFLRECPQSSPLQEPFCAMATDSGGSAIFSPAVQRWSEFPQSWLSGSCPVDSEAQAPSETFEVMGAAGEFIRRSLTWRPSSSSKFLNCSLTSYRSWFSSSILPLLSLSSSWVPSLLAL